MWCVEKDSSRWQFGTWRSCNDRWFCQCFFCFLSQMTYVSFWDILRMFFRSLFQNIVGFILLAHIYTSSLVISQAQHRWSLLLARRFALLPQQTEDELAISEACQNLLTLHEHDIISPRSWWLQVHSKLDRALKFLQRDVGLGDLVQEHDHSSRVMHLSMSGSQKFEISWWICLVFELLTTERWNFHSNESSEFLSFVGFPYILTLALSGPNSDQVFLFRSLWIILAFVLERVSDCKSSLLCLMDPYGASSCPFSYSSFFLPHHS